MNRTPNSYKPASWRCSLPFDQEAGGIGVAFDLETGEPIRLFLDQQSAEHLVETVSRYLGDHSQSTTSSGIPSGRLEAAIAQLEAVLDAGNERDDQRVEQVICTFDAEDLGPGLEQHRIEIRAMMRNGAFQKIAEIAPESLDPALFHRVFKILSAGQQFQSNVAPIP